MEGRALLAWNIRRLRAERRLSQERLAKEADIDRVYVSELENEHANLSVDLLDKLAIALKAPLSEFFRVPEPGEKRPRILASGRPQKSKAAR